MNHAKAIESGSNKLSGRALDNYLIKAEQSGVQAGLDSLSPQLKDSVISDINKSFQFAINNPYLFIGGGGDGFYVSILKQVQDDLGTKIDFGNQEHREAIGSALTNAERNR